MNSGATNSEMEGHRIELRSGKRLNSIEFIVSRILEVENVEFDQKNQEKYSKSSNISLAFGKLKWTWTPLWGPLFKSLDGVAYGRFIKKLIILGVLKIKNVGKCLSIILKNQ